MGVAAHHARGTQLVTTRVSAVDEDVLSSSLLWGSDATALRDSSYHPTPFPSFLTLPFSFGGVHFALPYVYTITHFILCVVDSCVSVVFKRTSK